MGMTVANMQSLTDVQRDALREVANIGAGHAATALSLMTGVKIMISVPTITVAPLRLLGPSIAAADDRLAMVPMELSGNLSGLAVLVFPLSTAHSLSGLMLRRAPVHDVDLTELEASAIKEAGNILAGAYMTALSEFMGMQLMVSPPRLSLGTARETLATLADGSRPGEEYVFCVETRFMMDEDSVTLPGYFLLLPDAGSLSAMLTAVRAG